MSKSFLIKIYYLIILLITSIVLFSLVFNQNIYNKKTIVLNNNSDQDLTKDNLYSIKIIEEQLSNPKFKIEEIKQNNIIPYVAISKLPDDLKKIKSIKSRKELFIKITLPLIVKENDKLTKLNRKIKKIKSSLDIISRDEALWVKELMLEYEANSLDKLIIKVDSIPVSLALAQAVIESGWGTSRFAYEGNALFGQYIWDNQTSGIVPNERETNAKYKIKSFDSLRESVASYMKNLNTNFHYNEFRLNRFILRSNNISLDGTLLAEYLYNYSIEEDYINKIKEIIQTNNFNDFENIKIEPNQILATDII